MSAVSRRSSRVLSKAAALVIEPLERRALLSAGSILHTEYTDLAGDSDTGGAVVRVDGQKLLQIGLSDSDTSNPIFVVARFNPDGTPDNDFGGGSSNIVTNAIPDSSYFRGAVNGAAVDASGRIVVVGRVDSPDPLNPFHIDSNFFVARFTSGGVLDPDFSTDGVNFGDFFTDRETEARALAIGSGGTIYVAGGARFNDDLFSVAQFNSDGELDGFGIAQTPTLEDPADGTDSVDTVRAIAIDAGGNIILAGNSLARFAGEDRFVIAMQRYLPTGVLDNTFDFDGSRRFDVPTPNVTAVGDRAFSVALDQLGRIIVGGTTDGPVEDFDSFVLMRFLSTGELDDSFNELEEAGIARLYFGGTTSALISDIAIQSDGAILVGGNVLTCINDCGEIANSFAVARYAESGVLDSTFGTSGVVLTQNFQGGPPENNLATLALQSDAGGNQFVALGSWVNGDFISTSDDLVLVRIALSGATVDLAGPAMADEGQTVQFTATFSGGLATGIEFIQAQHRAAGTAGASPSTTVSYNWTITLDGASTPAASGSGTATDTLDIPFTPADNGLYHVLVSINGGEDTATHDISVSNLPPTATINGAPPSSDEGTPISLTSTVTDPGTADTFTYAWSVTKNGAAFNSGTSANFTFTPDDDGTYLVTLTVTDDDGGISEPASASIVVANVNPTATITDPPAGGVEGSDITVSGSGSDAGAADVLTLSWAVTKDGSAYATGSGSSVPFTPDDNGTYVVTLTVSDDDGGSDTEAATILVANVNPTATITDPPAEGVEGSGITVNGSGTDAGAADVLTLSWAVTKDGSAYATGSGSSVTFTPDDNGTYVVTLTVNDDDGGSDTDTVTILIANAPPVVDPISGPASGEEGVLQTFTSAFTDRGSADSWTITWNFGDGTRLTTAGAMGAISATHTYAAAGTYTVTLTVSDDDGGSDSESASIAIADASGSTLAINGTDGNDEISVWPFFFGILIVNVNGVYSLHAGVTQIVIHAGAGNDKVKVNHWVRQNTVVFAGEGNDSVKTGLGDDILIGGEGDDLLHGNDGRDILIGGAGRDRIVGNADSDILVAGHSAHDASLSALVLIQAEWTSGRSYGQRTANVVGGDVVIDGVPYLFGGERLNGESFLTPDGIHATVFDDAAVDVLTGSAGQDLFLFNGDSPIADILAGLSGDEFAADIDFLLE